MLICLLWGGLLSPLVAQKDGLAAINYRPKLALKYDILALFSPTPTIQLETEIKTNAHQALQISAGYINNLYVPNTDFDGYNFKAAYRAYTNRRRNISLNAFIGLQVFRKQVNASGTTQVWRNNMAYLERMPINVSNRTNGFYLVTGRVYPLFIGDWHVEWEAGLGLNQLKVDIADLPEDADFDGDLLNRGFGNPVQGEGHYILPGIFVSFKMVYPFD